METQTKPDYHFTAHDIDALLAAYPDYLFCKDRHSRYLGCNARFAALVGVENAKAIVGLTDFDLPWQVQGHRAQFFRHCDQAVLSGEQSVIRRLEVLALPNTPARLVYVTKQPLYDANDVIYGLLGIARDVSSEINTAATLENRLDKADCFKDNDQRLDPPTQTALAVLMSLSTLLNQPFMKTPHTALLTRMQTANNAIHRWLTRKERRDNTMPALVAYPPL